jgi:hypothetical protein
MGESRVAESPWYEFVAPRARRNLLRILAELSRLHEEGNSSFVIIGAFSLLLRGVLNYTVLWDLDLLFRDRESMETLIDTPKSGELEVQHLDPHLMVGETISSLHTAWRFEGGWFNVDYILIPGDYDFYLANPESETIFDSVVHFEGKRYPLRLPLAAPWDVAIKKLLSPRLERELEGRDSFSIDLRHIYHILSKYGEEELFWENLAGKAGYLGQLREVKSRLIELIALKDEVGYAEMKLQGSLSGRVAAL